MFNDDPTLAEMREFLTAAHFAEPDEETGLDGDAEAAIYFFAVDYHGGAGSSLYSVTASTDPALRCAYRPGPNSTLESEGEAAQLCYGALESKFT